MKNESYVVTNIMMYGDHCDRNASFASYHELHLVGAVCKDLHDGKHQVGQGPVKLLVVHHGIAPPVSIHGNEDQVSPGIGQDSTLQAWVNSEEEVQSVIINVVLPFLEAIKSGKDKIVMFGPMDSAAFSEQKLGGLILLLCAQHHFSRIPHISQHDGHPVQLGEGVHPFQHESLGRDRLEHGVTTITLGDTAALVAQHSEHHRYRDPRTQSSSSWPAHLERLVDHRGGEAQVELPVQHYAGLAHQQAVGGGRQHGLQGSFHHHQIGGAQADEVELLLDGSHTEDELYVTCSYNMGSRQGHERLKFNTSILMDWLSEDAYTISNKIPQSQASCKLDLGMCFIIVVIFEFIPTVSMVVFWGCIGLGMQVFKIIVYGAAKNRTKAIYSDVLSEAGQDLQDTNDADKGRDEFTEPEQLVVVHHGIDGFAGGNEIHQVSVSIVDHALSVGHCDRFCGTDDGPLDTVEVVGGQLAIVPTDLPAVHDNDSHCRSCEPEKSEV